MKKFLSVVTATILAAGFAMPLNAAPMFVPKPEQVKAGVVENVNYYHHYHHGHTGTTGTRGGPTTTATIGPTIMATIGPTTRELAFISRSSRDCGSGAELIG